MDTKVKYITINYKDSRSRAYLEKLLIEKMNKVKDPKAYAELLGSVCNLRERRFG